DNENRTHKEALNPYLITFRQGIQHVKNQLQMREHFLFGMDELAFFKYDSDSCKSAISSKMDDSDILLHDIYKHLPHYPIIQIHWEIVYRCMVSYRHTISTEKINLQKSIPIQNTIILPNERLKFNPLLYECDVHKVKIIQDVIAVKLSYDYGLRELFCEVIKNDYLCDLVTIQYTNKKEKDKLCENIKQQIHFNEKDEDDIVS
ncbi:hypothetical protein RFI_18994, partial [Reticulomyxa filosa]